MQFPAGEYFQVRFTDVDFTDSKSSGNPMIVVSSEVVSPTEVEIGGEMVNIAGVEPKPMYFTTLTLHANGEVNVDKSAANKERLSKLYNDLGLDFSKFDPQNPDISVLKGLVVLCAMGADVEEQRRTPTAEQLAKKEKGTIMTHPVTGAKLVFYSPKVTEVYALAPAEGAGKPKY